MKTFTRRQGLGFAAAAGLAGTAATPSSARSKKPKIDFVRNMDLKSPEFNRDVRARLNGDLAPDTEYVGWLKGIVQGVRPNEANRDLFGFEGFSVTRMYRRPDGSWRKLLRETVIYRDLESGEILETWLNPYTNETVRVVPIANDPYNMTIGTHFLGKPLLLDWNENPDGTYTILSTVNLFYPNLLQPSKWPRESSGDFAEPYIELVLHKLGLRWPRRPTTDPTRWSALLRESLGVKTRLIRRVGCR